MTDLVSQLATLAEEGALSDAEQSAKHMGQQLQELADRLAVRKQALKVQAHQFTLRVTAQYGCSVKGRPGISAHEMRHISVQKVLEHHLS